jgi:hypothetical protein
LRAWPLTIGWVEEIFLDQMGDDLSIRFGGELVAFLKQSLFQRKIVLNDAVVHDYHAVSTIAMRVRVLFRRPAVCGPARVPDAVGPIQRLQTDGLFQIAQFALGAPNLQAIPIPRDSNAG